MRIGKMFMLVLAAGSLGSVTYAGETRILGGVADEAVHPGKFFVAPQVGGSLGTTGGDFKSNYRPRGGESIDKNLQSDPGLAAGVIFGYDSSIEEGGWGWGTGLEYLYQNEGGKIEYRNSNFGLAADFGFTDIHYVQMRAVARYRAGAWTPYFGASAGVGIFGYEVGVEGFGTLQSRTLVEPVVSPIVGFEYRFARDWSMFTEYKYLTTVRDMSLPESGGNARFEPFGSHCLTVGVKYAF